MQFDFEGMVRLVPPTLNDLKDIDLLIASFLELMEQTDYAVSEQEKREQEQARNNLECLRQRFSRPAPYSKSDLQALDAALLLFMVFLTVTFPPSERRVTALDLLRDLRGTVAALQDAVSSALS